MSEEMKNNTPIDPNAPEEPKESKTPETPTTRIKEKLQKEEEKIIEYKKDVRFLWIYASVFCLVLLLLIGASYFIQQKIHAEVDEYRITAENATLSSTENQSRLQNISDENKYLKSQNELLESEISVLESKVSSTAELLNGGDKIILQMQKLLDVYEYHRQGNTQQAIDVFNTIDASVLPKSAKETYDNFAKILNTEPEAE